ncbi:hypothetical protein [Rhizobium sp. RU36D]|uniref:hypothetical protein n=1 Tax=Rhizobium sp. RU36D TaxID=1907415 RepID=UPI000A06A23D|nr:hypothetical protein [Rhizobium sp. RU36D]
MACHLIEEIGAAKADCGPVRLEDDDPLVLYGAGNLGRLARDHLNLVGRPIALVVDRDAAALSADPSWGGLPMAAPDNVPMSVKENGILAVSIVNFAFAPLQAALNDAGWKRVVPFYDVAEAFRDRHPLSNGWFAGEFAADDVTAMKQVVSAWSDDLSRAHYLQFVAWRRLREEWSFDEAPINIADRFFIPEVKAVLTDREVFVDAGAYDGIVLRRMIDETGGNFASIHAIEPDPHSASALSETVATLPPDMREKVTVSDALLAADARDARFHAGLGYASQIAATGQTVRRTTPLDILDIAPSFVKLHLEGGELSALIGAQTMLLTHRPLLAITVYHNADGIVAIPEWLRNTLSDYRFLFRLHSWCGTGAVVYAIPEERYRAHV